MEKLIVSRDMLAALQTKVKVPDEMASTPVRWDAARVHVVDSLPDGTAFVFRPPPASLFDFPFMSEIRPFYTLCHSSDRWMSYSSESRDWSTLCGTRWRVFECLPGLQPDGWEPCTDWDRVDQTAMRMEYVREAAKRDCLRYSALLTTF